MKIFEKLNKKFIQFLPLIHEDISNSFPELPSEIFRKRLDTVQFAYPVSMINAEPLIVNHNSEVIYADDIILDDKQSDIQTFYRTNLGYHIDDFTRDLHKYIVSKDKGLVHNKYNTWIYPPKNRYKFSNHNIVADNIGLIYMPYHIWNRPLHFRSIYEIAEVIPSLKKNKKEEDQDYAVVRGN